MNLTKTILVRWERKRLAVELLGGKCSICGYSKNLASLDFHHTDPETKEDAIGYMVACHQWEKVKEELKKCILVCKTCHTEIHNEKMEYELVDGRVRLVDDLITSKLNSQCERCGEVSYGHRFCTQKCSQLASRRVERPSKELLESDLESMSMLAIGRKYIVSDNAVRKWIKYYGIGKNKVELLSNSDNVLKTNAPVVQLDRTTAF